MRLGSLEPGLLTQEFLQTVSKYDNLCPHFHVSLQSGSEAVLQRMGRKYTARQYSDTIKRVRDRYPAAGITTDVMVGFPGESEAEHEESMAFVGSIGFSRLHVFAYSPRKGTAAAAYDNQLDKAVKDARSGQMQRLGETLEQSFLRSMAGKTEWVLFEKCNQNGDSEGYTANYCRVLGKASEGEMKKVSLQYRKGCLYGTDAE